MNDSLAMIVTADCKNCKAVQESEQFSRQFDNLKRLKCPRFEDGSAYCESFVTEGIKGNILKTKLELGSTSYELGSTMLLDDVPEGHSLRSAAVSGVVGFRQPDYDGNYDKAFLRQT